MWYHAITSYNGKNDRYWWNRSREDLISDILIPFITKQVMVVTKSGDKSIFNFGNITYMTLLRTEDKLKRPRPGAIPSELKDNSFVKEHNITEEFINESKLITATVSSQSLLQFSFAEPKNQIFVIMKFDDRQLDSLYEGVIKPVGEDEFGYEVVRVDEIQDSGNINKQILENIAKSKIILAELSGERPNCYYEAGFAHALGKEIIFSANENTHVHFDLASYRFIRWGTESDFRRQFRERLSAIQARETDG